MNNLDEDSDEILLIGGSFVILLLLLFANLKKKRDRKMRVHPYLQERSTKGRFNTAVNSSIFVCFCKRTFLITLIKF